MGRVATEAAWLNGNNLEKEEIKKREKQKNGRKALTLTGLLKSFHENTRRKMVTKGYVARNCSLM
jgi:hypothetical protein